MKRNALAMLAVLLTASGCASIVRGTKEDVTIQTRPSNAAVSTSIGQSCPRSPCTLKVPRRTPFTAYASKPGYGKGQIEIKTKFSKGGVAGMAGNLLLPGGSVGAIVDVVDGATLDHYPTPAVIVLGRSGGKATAVVHNAPMRKRPRHARVS